ncbi:alpha/beta hydrolase [Kitasatospora aureofaciens]|uniref:alpha/beta hydrolase n=1 Tax=Kitasatospora aureofaciens TaxID=1894 RepID=UPI001C47D785|nr:dienelactone hydrolase family protein [Kitasatospora aureofaciens]MBV6703040.1 dienelactone hydrolase family protein [Kitasatospora aureofaciens]
MSVASGTSPLIDADAVLWSVPEADRNGKPLLVMMHGWSYDETHLFQLTPRMPRELVVASLRAPIPEAGGYAWFPSRGNPIGNPRPTVANAMTGAVLEWLDAQPTFSSVGLIGFSQGGGLALQLLRHAPSRFSYAVQLAGFVVNDSQPGDRVLAITKPPVFWGRGALDAVIPDDAIVRTATWMTKHTDADVHVYPRLGHHVAGQEIDDLAAFITHQVEVG